MKALILVGGYGEANLTYQEVCTLSRLVEAFVTLP